MTVIEPVPLERRFAPSKDVIDSIVVGVVLTAISYIVGLWVNWIAEINWLEVFAVFTSYSCTWLCVKERRINYPIGAISTAAYALLFYQADLMASMVLNIYLTPYLVYGWIRWRHDEDTRPITKVSAKMWPVYLSIAGAGYLVAVYLSKTFDGAMAWTDSVILAATLLAQTLMDNKKLENWIVWAVVNVFAIYTYFNIGLPLVGFQYIFFLANTVYGFWTWKNARNYA